MEHNLKFEIKDLVEFGEYLLSEERKERFQATTQEMSDNKIPIQPTEERLKSVWDADLRNWLNEKGVKISTNT